MTKDEALRVGIDALENAENVIFGNWGGNCDEYQEAIKIMEKALAEPKPNEGIEGSIRIFLKKSNGQWERLEKLEQVHEYNKQQLAQPEQEPEDLTIAYMAGLSRGKDLVPQRTWVGLSTDEFKFIASKYLLSKEAGLEYFQEEIEAKLREKNT